MFLTKFLNKDTSNKKVSSIIYYNKYYIRNTLLNLKTHLTVDNNVSFLNQDLRKINNTKVGQSLLLKDKLFKNDKSSIKFNFTLNHYNIEITSLLNNFKKVSNLFSQKERHLDGLLLNPIKGGFNCYSCGVIGFLPRTHAVASFNFLLDSLYLLSKKRKSSASFFSLLTYFLNDSLLKQKYVLRIPVFLGNLSLFPYNKKNNFSSSLKKKIRTYPGKLNLVFLFYVDENTNP